MLIVLLLIDGVGYEYLAKDSFWYRNSMCIKNSVPTITCPNWLTILSGLRPIDHGVLKNEDFRPKDYVFPKTTIFDDVPDSMLISDWKVFHKVSKKPKFMHANTWKAIKNLKICDRDQLIVLNYMHADNIGHKYGWNSKEYHKILRYIDQETQKLYEKLIRCSKPFVLLGVSDHGGDEHKDHENEHDKNTRNVPLLFISNMSIKKPSIKSNTEIRGYMKKIINRHSKFT